MEADILLYIQNNLRNPVLDPVMAIITHLCNGAFIWIALIVLLLMIKKTRRTGIACTAALLINVTIVNLIIKNLVGRIRPYDVISELELLIERQWDSSFPSGHTASSFAVAFAFFLKTPKKYGIPALVLAALIGFSRLYVGVHYPSDVLCGMIIGMLSAFIAVKVTDRVFARMDRKKQEKPTEE
ncbi:MAG: phosphatase PAP2 family protein [Lachnospiraceae bacterium]|nr:phosphatase PAP2 family protein [Lachnospiraceae bacterium]